MFIIPLFTFILGIFIYYFVRRVIRLLILQLNEKYKSENYFTIHKLSVLRLSLTLAHYMRNDNEHSGELKSGIKIYD